MINALCFDSITGASGDMILGALFDLGVPVDLVDLKIRSTGIAEFQLSFKRITDHTGLTAGRCEVKIEESHHHRKLSDIEAIIGRGDFSDNIKDKAMRIFRRIAEAEAKVHNTTINDVHFHEVGAVDAIVDILGSIIAIDYLKPQKIFCGPLKTGRGTVECAHGRMPVPAPATVEILKGFPTVNLPIDSELTTPTGAAIITTLCEGDYYGHPMRMINVGYGLGSKRFENRSNVLRVLEVVLDEKDRGQDVEIIETDIDDESPEIIGLLRDKLKLDGVRDVSIQPVSMKKGRLGFRITVIADEGKAAEVANILFIHSSTIGVRIHSARRIVLPREEVKIKTKWGELNCKKIKRPDRVEVVPEYEECLRIAEKYNISVREVMREVLRNG